MMDDDWSDLRFEFKGFEWDHDKAIANWRKHKVGFEEAPRIFGQSIVARIEPVDNEVRYIGASERRLLTAVFTERGEYCRIISARKAEKAEQRRYRSHLGG